MEEIDEQLSSTNYESDRLTVDHTDSDRPIDTTDHALGDHGAEALDYSGLFHEQLEYVNREAAEALFGKTDLTDLPEHERLEFIQDYVSVHQDVTGDASHEDRYAASEALAHQMITPYRDIYEAREGVLIFEGFNSDEITVDNLREQGVNFNTHDVIVIPDQDGQPPYQLTDQGQVVDPTGSSPRAPGINTADEYEINGLTLDQCEETIVDILVDTNQNLDAAAQRIDEILVHAAHLAKTYHQDDHDPNTDLADTTGSEIRDETLRDLTGSLGTAHDLMTVTSITRDIYDQVREQLEQAADRVSDITSSVTDVLHVIRNEQAYEAVQDDERFAVFTDQLVGDLPYLVGINSDLDLDADDVHPVDLPDEFLSERDVDQFILNADRFLTDRQATDDDTIRSIAVATHILNEMRATTEAYSASAAEWHHPDEVGLSEEDLEALHDQATQIVHVADRMIQ